MADGRSPVQSPQGEDRLAEKDGFGGGCQEEELQNASALCALVGGALDVASGPGCGPQLRTLSYCFLTWTQWYTMMCPYLRCEILWFHF